MPQERFGEPLPAGPEPVRVPPGPSRPGWRLTVGLCLAASAVTALLLWALGNRARAPQEGQTVAPVRTAVATTGEFLKRLRVGGTVETLDYAAIRAPRLRGPRDSGRASLTLVRLAEAGTLVERGSIVADFELKWLEDHIEDRQSVVVQARSNLRKREAEVLILQETERQALVNAKAEFNKAVLDLRTAEVRSEIEAEILGNLADQARTAWNQLQLEGPLMEQVHRADVRGFELQVREEVLHVERHERDLERLELRTPVGGLVVLETMMSPGGQFAQTKAGDQVYPGALFMRIVDISQMVVAATVNQVDAQALRIGNEAVVELDAYPGARFRGHVADIGAVASSGGVGKSRYSRGNTGNYIKHLPAKILIDDKDPRILPDLSAGADVLLADRQQGLLVPREAVRREPGAQEARPFVHVVEDGEYRKRPVIVRDVSDTEALIASGLEAGEEVLLSALPGAAAEPQ